MFTILISILNMIVQGGSALISLSIAAKYLDSNDLALWAIGGATYGYISLLDLGASMLVQRSVASNQASLVQQAGIIAKTLFVILGILGTLIYLLAFLLPNSAFIMMIGAMIARVSVNVFSAILIANGAMITERICRIFSSIMLVIIQYLILSYTSTILALPVSIYLSGIAYLALVFLLSKTIRVLIIHARLNVFLFWENRIEHINWLFYTIPALFIYNFEVFALKIWSDNSSVTIFSSAHQIYYSVTSLFSIITILSSVVISARHYSKSADRNEAIINNLLTISVLVSISLSFLTVFLAPINKLLFPSINISEYKYLWFIYGLFLIIEASQMSLTNALINTGKTNFTLVNLASATINVCSCYILIPWFGLHGAVAALIISQSLTGNYFNIRKAVHTFSLRWRDVLACIFLPMLLYIFIISFYWITRPIDKSYQIYFDLFYILGFCACSIFYLIPKAIKVVSTYNKCKEEQTFQSR